MHFLMLPVCFQLYKPAGRAPLGVQWAPSWGPGCCRGLPPSPSKCSGLQSEQPEWAPLKQSRCQPAAGSAAATACKRPSETHLRKVWNIMVIKRDYIVLINPASFCKHPFYFAADVWHLEKSCLTLFSSPMVCRFLRAGYREDTASRLPLQSSSTSAPLWKHMSQTGYRFEHIIAFYWSKLKEKSTIPSLFESFIKHGEVFVPYGLQGTKHRFMDARFG